MLRCAGKFGFALLLTALSCGGNVEGGAKDPDENTPTTTPSGSEASGDTDDTATDNPDADTALGSCTLGPKENLASSEPCAWVADNRCYQTHEMACNCACPRSRNSQCSSGFEAGPNGHVWVACN
jgi:hypothetical protein